MTGARQITLRGPHWHVNCTSIYGGNSVLACDISNYTSDLTPAALEQWKQAGVGLVIVQSIEPPAGYPVGRTRLQVQQCLDAGLSVDVYIWLWFDLPLGDIAHKLDLIDGLDIQQLFLDVEDTAAVKYSQAECEEKVAAALNLCDLRVTANGQRCGVYSGRWYWADARYMGNTTLCADRELWDANYDGVVDAALGFVPYGGWTSARIKQYRGSTSLAGISGLDLNVLSVEEAAEIQGLPPAPPPVEENPCAGLIVTVADIADRLGDQILAEANRKAGPRKTELKRIVAEMAAEREQAIGKRP